MTTPEMEIVDTLDASIDELTEAVRIMDHLSCDTEARTISQWAEHGRFSLNAMSLEIVNRCLMKITRNTRVPWGWGISARAFNNAFDLAFDIHGVMQSTHERNVGLIND